VHNYYITYTSRLYRHWGERHMQHGIYRHHQDNMSLPLRSRSHCKAQCAPQLISLNATFSDFGWGHCSSAHTAQQMSINLHASFLFFLQIPCLLTSLRDVTAQLDETTLTATCKCRADRFKATILSNIVGIDVSITREGKLFEITVLAKADGRWRQ
jgi:hypothetical protein